MFGICDKNGGRMNKLGRPKYMKNKIDVIDRNRGNYKSAKQKWKKSEDNFLFSRLLGKCIWSKRKTTHEEAIKRSGGQGKYKRINVMFAKISKQN